MAKTYYFSNTKHAHDIEFYANRLKNTMYSMESGEIPMDEKRYDRIHDMYYGPLMELRDILFGSGPIAQLTGPQIGLAKEIVAWASNTRALTAEANGRRDLLQYC